MPSENRLWQRRQLRIQRVSSRDACRVWRITHENVSSISFQQRCVRSRAFIMNAQVQPVATRACTRNSGSLGHLRLSMVRRACPRRVRKVSFRGFRHVHPTICVNWRSSAARQSHHNLFSRRSTRIDADRNEADPESVQLLQAHPVNRAGQANPA